MEKRYAKRGQLPRTGDLERAEENYGQAITAGYNQLSILQPGLSTKAVVDQKKQYHYLKRQ